MLEKRLDVIDPVRDRFCKCGKLIKYATETKCEDCYADYLAITYPSKILKDPPENFRCHNTYYETYGKKAKL